jgi:hypothetical protein
LQYFIKILYENTTFWPILQSLQVEFQITKKADAKRCATRRNATMSACGAFEVTKKAKKPMLTHRLFSI